MHSVCVLFGVSIENVHRNICLLSILFFFSSRRRHTRFKCDWSSDVCSSDLFLLQALILAIGGGLVGLGLALLVAMLLEATPLWLVVIWTIPVMLAFACISILYPLWQLWHIRPAELLRAGSTVSSGKSKLPGSRIGGRLMPISTLVLRNLSRSRMRA